nr:MAG TPA: hypothetical protein [Caudoviricetes sp.]
MVNIDSFFCSSVHNVGLSGNFYFIKFMSLTASTCITTSSQGIKISSFLLVFTSSITFFPSTIASKTRCPLHMKLKFI